MALKELAKLFVRIRAPREELRSDLGAAKQDVEQFGRQAEATGAKVNATLGETGAKIKEATKGTRDFVGAITGAIGAVTRVLGILGLVTAAIAGIVTALGAVHEWLVKNTSQAKEFRDRMRETTEGSEKIVKELNEVKVDPAVDQLKRIGEEIGVLEADAGVLREALSHVSPGAGTRQTAEMASRLRKIQDDLIAKQAEADSIRDASSGKRAREEADNQKKLAEAQAQSDRNAAAFRTKMSMDIIEGEVDAIESGLNAQLEANKARAKSDRAFEASNIKMAMERIESEVDAMIEVSNRKRALIKEEEDYRLRLQMENFQRMQALQNQAAQSNNSLAYDIRRIEMNTYRTNQRLN